MQFTGSAVQGRRLGWHLLKRKLLAAEVRRTRCNSVGWIKRSGSTVIKEHGGSASLDPPYKNNCFLCGELCCKSAFSETTVVNRSNEPIGKSEQMSRIINESDPLNLELESGTTKDGMTIMSINNNAGQSILRFVTHGGQLVVNGRIVGVQRIMRHESNARRIMKGLLTLLAHGVKF